MKESRNESGWEMIAMVVAPLALAVAVVALLCSSCPRIDGTSPEQVGTKSAVELLRGLNAEKSRPQELSSWQRLQMAIAFTESRFNPDAQGTAQDSGILQLRPIYVAEVNRIAGTEYTIEDAFDVGKSLEMFSLLQEYYNPDRDIDIAIYYHNKSRVYRAEVLRNLELIDRYEALREIVHQ